MTELDFSEFEAPSAFVEIENSPVIERMRELNFTRKLTDLHRHFQLQTYKVDMSSEAITRRLRQTDQLRELSLSLMKAKKESEEKKQPTQETPRVYLKVQ